MRHRLRVAEAASALLTARLLVAAVPFGSWRRSLGRVLVGAGPEAGTDPPALKPLLDAHGRALERLPWEFKCLPRAVALHWMLRRRGIASVLSIGALPRHGRGRGTIDDLHAWVTVNGVVRHGDSEEGYAVLARLG